MTLLENLTTIEKYSLAVNLFFLIFLFMAIYKVARQTYLERKFVKMRDGILKGQEYMKKKGFQKHKIVHGMPHVYGTNKEKATATFRVMRRLGMFNEKKPDANE